VDTSSKEIAIGVFSGSKTLSENYISVNKNYNAVLMPLIEDNIKKSRIKLEEIDVFAATLGPGSFTGIRVGMAAMKGFTQALGKVFYGASVLETMAEASEEEGTVWPVLDAGRGEIYTAKFIIDKSGHTMKGRYMLLSRENFLKRAGRNDAVITLKMENLAEQLLLLKPGIKCMEHEHISMKSLYNMAKEHPDDKKALYTMAPIYIRPSEAEATLKRKKKAERQKR
jgi:tRNA threonylcarbamoyladenosine biosynthesis protein TsaB